MSPEMSTETSRRSAEQHEGGGNALKLVLAWLFVGIPLLYGIIMTVMKATALFTG